MRENRERTFATSHARLADRAERLDSREGQRSPVETGRAAIVPSQTQVVRRAPARLGQTVRTTQCHRGVALLRIGRRLLQPESRLGLRQVVLALFRFFLYLKLGHLK